MEVCHFDLLEIPLLWEQSWWTASCHPFGSSTTFPQAARGPLLSYHAGVTSDVPFLPKADILQQATVAQGHPQPG